MRFFDDYVHDSFAGFYLAGQVTEYDKRFKVAGVLAQKPENLTGFDKRVFDVASQTRAAQEKKKAGQPLTADEGKLVSTGEYGTPYPIMTDADSADMRSPAITTQTATRREGGGYVLRRGYYPQSGFFMRKSIHEKQLQRLPTVKLRKDRADEVAVELVWSDDLRHDIAEAREVDDVQLARASTMA